MNSAHKAVVPFCPLVARPARKQSEEFGGKVDQPTGSVFNIWYSKWAGGDRFQKNTALEKAEHRCSILNDCGYTRATKSSSFCIHFARGVCAKGSECNFWHRIPLPIDRVPMAQDVFGRDRHRDEREDMGGVGSFEKDNRTLYVGQLGLEGGLEDMLYRHFIEWGEIELLKGKGVAFIRYKSRTSAEFAKEAMHCQSLDNSEIVNVRWATEDPNPKAALLNRLKDEEKVMNAVKASLPVIGEHGTILDYLQRSVDEENALANEENEEDQDSASAEKNVNAPPKLSEIGWDTPNGFFYKANEVAAVSAAKAEEQFEKSKTRVDEEYYASNGGDLSGESIATLEGRGGPEKEQGDGAKYVLGVGKSRIYTGEGMGHAAVREKIVEAVVSGTMKETGFGVGGVSQGGAGAGGVGGLGNVGKGGFWPRLPQQQQQIGGAKKPRIELVSSGRRAISDAEEEQDKKVPLKGGILSSGTIQYLQQLKERQGNASVGVKRKAPTSSGLSLAGNYASDSE